MTDRTACRCTQLNGENQKAEQLSAELMVKTRRRFCTPPTNSRAFFTDSFSRIPRTRHAFPDKWIMLAFTLVATSFPFCQSAPCTDAHQPPQRSRACTDGSVRQLQSFNSRPPEYCRIERCRGRYLDAISVFELEPTTIDGHVKQHSKPKFFELAVFGECALLRFRISGTSAIGRQSKMFCGSRRATWSNRCGLYDRKVCFDTTALRMAC